MNRKRALPPFGENRGRLPVQDKGPMNRKRGVRLKRGQWARLAVLGLFVGSCVVVPRLRQPPPPQPPRPACTFTLGFAQMQEMLGPSITGPCIENEHFNPANGNAEQRTTKGLLVWRKADNWMAFTDGHATWVNGPAGALYRLNWELYCFEAGNDPETCKPIPRPE